MVRSILIGLLAVIPFFLSGQIDFINSFGSSETDLPRDVFEHPDGGFILASSISAGGADVSNYYGGIDIWIVKTDDQGNIEWERNYGGSEDDYPESFQETSDGNYVIVGRSYSVDGDITAPIGNSDIWMFSIDKDGELLWERSYGGNSYEEGVMLLEDPTGGYYLFGNGNSFDGDITDPPEGSDDIFVFKLDENFDIIWQQAYGGQGLDLALDAKMEADGSIIISGRIFGGGGDVTTYYGESDIWLLKISSNGDIIWENTIGGSLADFCTQIILQENNQYLLIGATQSSDQDIEEAYGDYDGLIALVDSNGELIELNNYGGSDHDAFFGSTISSTGQLVLHGRSSSSDGFLSYEADPNIGTWDCWLVSLHENMDLDWQYRFGGSDIENIQDLFFLSDNELICLGYTASTDGDMPSEIDGFTNGFLAKIDTDVLNASPMTIVLTETSEPLVCPGDSTGAVSAFPIGGSGGNIYSWDYPGISGNEVDQLPAGEYCLTVTDNSGNTATSCIEITAPPAFELNLSSTPATFGNEDGTASVEVQGGTPDYSYVWNTEPPQESATATDLAPGIYTVSITDLLGCEVSDSLEVGQLTSIETNNEIQQIRVYPNPGTDLIYLEVNSSKSVDFTIQLLGPLGQHLKTLNFPASDEIRHTLDTSSYPPGIYWLNIRHEGGQSVRKLIIQ